MWLKSQSKTVDVNISICFFRFSVFYLIVLANLKSWFYSREKKFGEHVSENKPFSRYRGCWKNCLAGFFFIFGTEWHLADGLSFRLLISVYNFRDCCRFKDWCTFYTVTLRHCANTIFFSFITQFRSCSISCARNCVM